MATSFKASDVLVGTVRTLLYTCPAGTEAVVFSGTLANVDNTSFQEHWIIAEVQKTDTTYVPVLNRVAIPFGNSLTLPKIALAAGEKIYLRADTTNIIQARLSVVEKV